MLERLAASGLSVRTILLVQSIDTPEIVEALQFGACGVLARHSAADLLFKSIDAVMAGQYWIGRECVADLIDQMRKRATPPPSEPVRPTFGLTPRELEIISTVAAGYTNSEMAEKLSISVKTVKHHLTNIFNKLGVENRLELALFAVHHRLATPLH
jgi:DNA-binding NarL/FixJ family response regulator